MKRILLVTSLIFAMSFGSCQKVGGENTETPEIPDVPAEEEKGFVAEGWNGYFVEEMAAAYEFFLENNRMPSEVNVEGIKYGRGKMFAASYKLVQKIMNEPETWQENEVDFNDTFSCPDNEKNNTINVDSLSFDEFMGYAKRAYEYAETNKALPNYVTMQSNYTDKDGSIYDVKVVINALSLGFARIFHHYKEHNEFPAKISAWHSDYLHSTTNCPKDDPVVKSKLEEIIAGKTTDYEKAEAIFYYSLDEWEWVNYSNTSKGAVKTINEGKGNCCDLSHAVVALGRAAGLPSRYRHAQCKYKASGSIIGHVMAEIYVDGQWYLCDPSSSGTTFGNHEAWSTMATFNGFYDQLPF